MKIYIDIYGCTANKSDAAIANHLIKNHAFYDLTESIKEADIILLFSCTVISTTEQKILSRIKKYYASGKKIIVAGCMASIQSNLIHLIDEKIICIPPQDIHHLISYLEHTEQIPVTALKYEIPKIYASVIAPIAISEGCTFACTYCITTLARGKLTSVPIDLIKKDIKQALQQGCKEIQLTAQDTASYGIDRQSTLSELLGKLAVIKGSYRTRIGMMNPSTLRPQLEKIIHCYQNDHIYKFMHLPVQSGSNEILEKMHRHYTIEEVTDMVQKFRNHFPDITYATDIIVGFPTETEEQFNQTKQLLTTQKPDIVNITKFSARPHTVAKAMKGRIPTHIVKKRSRELTLLLQDISLQRNKEKIGNSYTILITEKGKHNTMIGRAENYKPVVIQKPLPIGSWTDVEIIDAGQTYLVGMLK